jgi:Tol biopolymer transport system component
MRFSRGSRSPERAVAGTSPRYDDGGGLSYSPSGKKIVYSGRDAPNGDYEIYTINPGGGSKFRVTDNNTGDYTPSWGSS